ncbi:ABC transporter permease [Gryllotalpicola protaetiae]|uniref:ABC transporter permease subunit n=1 Tax=Gryllotalpicola protaetiae TaxID=2419771 RepID=A0A387BIZ0_9MICO|nr:ABC transporter permease subunit [Gryllotalpicola protaetiae]AYG03783.1 ABC transporter permease subunit [Gryllotalpicola protaetiae]
MSTSALPGRPATGRADARDGGAPGWYTRLNLTAIITWFAGIVFVLLVIAILVSVIVASFGVTWRTGWWPQGFTTKWYAQAWTQTGVPRSLLTTFEVAFASVAVALLAGIPCAYVMARKSFPFKSVVLLLLLLPATLPPLTYAVQLAALMYRLGIGGSVLAVILVNVVPALPFVILITVPFVEQVSPEVENAARVFGANGPRLFGRVLVPIMAPGIVAAAILCLVRVLGAFDLTFFVSSQRSETLVVTIFAALSAPGGVPVGLAGAMSMFYVVVAFIGLAVSLRFANPAQAFQRLGR